MLGIPFYGALFIKYVRKSRKIIYQAIVQKIRWIFGILNT